MSIEILFLARRCPARSSVFGFFCAHLRALAGRVAVGGGWPVFAPPPVAADDGGRCPLRPFRGLSSFPFCGRPPLRHLRWRPRRRVGSHHAHQRNASHRTAPHRTTTEAPPPPSRPSSSSASRRRLAPHLSPALLAAPFPSLLRAPGRVRASGRRRRPPSPQSHSHGTELHASFGSPSCPSPPAPFSIRPSRARLPSVLSRRDVAGWALGSVSMGSGGASRPLPDGPHIVRVLRRDSHDAASHRLLLHGADRPSLG